MRAHALKRAIAFVPLAMFVLSTSTIAQQGAATPTVQALISKAHAAANQAKSLADYTAALQQCSDVIKANPSPEQKAYVYKLAGWTYNKRGETLVKLSAQIMDSDPKRAAEYEVAAVKDFGLASQFDKTSWKARFNRAVSIAMNGEYEKALADLDFVIQSQPKHKNALFNRGEILLQLGEYERAVEDYAKVIELDTKDAAAFAGRGIALSAIGDTDNALVDLNAAVRLQPERAEAYVDRADLYAAMGDWDRAAGDYRVAIKLDNKLGRAYQNVAWMMATCPDKQYRNPSLAVRAANKAIQLDGPTYLGLDTYAAALASAGQYANAIASQKKAIETAPAEEHADLNSRLALYEQKQPFVESAESEIQLASGEEPLPPE